MRIAVTTPLYVNNNNHRDFLNRFTRSIALSSTFIWIPVENHVAAQYSALPYMFTQQPDEVYALKGRQPQSVAKGWNDGIAKARELDANYVLVCNTDIVLRTDAIDRLVNFAETHPEFLMWTMGGAPDLFALNTMETDENVSEHPNFSCWMVKPDLFDKTGTFDEHYLPAYYEDNDMHGRMVKLGYKAVIYGGARFFHFGSGTTNGDVELRAEMPKYFVNNRDYFRKKFGRDPLGEVDEMRGMYFPHPFNDRRKDWRKWE